MIKQRKSALDLDSTFYALAFIFAAGLFIVITYYTWTQISTPIETAVNNVLPAGEQSFNVTSLNAKVNTGISVFNVMFPFLILGLFLMVIVSAFYINSHPVFFFISLVVLIVMIVLAVVFSNIYQQIIETPELSAVGEEFKITQLFLKNLPLIASLIFIVTVIVLFGLNRNSSGGATGGL